MRKSHSTGKWVFGAACYTFPRHSPGESSDRRVPFLKALFTGARTFLSHAERMPKQTISLRAGVLHRPVETSSGKQQPHPTDPILISQRML